MKNKSMTSEEVKQRENDFQMWQHHFREFNDQQSSDWCFYAIRDCCHNIALKKAVGKQIPDLDDSVMDATLDIFKRWKGGMNIKKLSSFCYLYVIGRLKTSTLSWKLCQHSLTK